MTDPLIDRDALSDHISVTRVDPRIEDWPGAIADAVLAYLRSVLTPEALEPTGGVVPVIGYRLHRRIFGED